MQDKKAEMQLADNLEVLAIGNAIVDVLGEQEEAFLVEHHLAKGAMQLVSADEATRLHAAMEAGGHALHEVSGGSAANTAVGVAAFGGRAAFIGRVADDRIGQVFAQDLEAAGVLYPVAPVGGGLPTGRCLVVVTPDGERTMNTALGISAELAREDIDAALVKRAAVTYLEGYLWDSPSAVEAVHKATRAAHAAHRQVALALSDAFCVDRHRREFLALAAEVDVVIANEVEAKALFSTEDMSGAVAGFAAIHKLAVITRSEKGAIIVSEGERLGIPAEKASVLKDATGAGDLFAAGFLLGLARGLPHRDCGIMGAVAGAEAVEHLGARPVADLKERLRQRLSQAAV